MSLSRYVRATLASKSMSAVVSPTIQTRNKRYQAFDAGLDQEKLAEARSWYQAFNSLQLPNGNTTYARSSGPGGQHVNKTETKAITTYPVKELLSILPQQLHSAVRASKYYTAGNDSLTFQAQTHRFRTANQDENREKLTDEIHRMYREQVPAETSSDKKERHKEIEKDFHQGRINSKKLQSSKKQSRKGSLD